MQGRCREGFRTFLTNPINKIILVLSTSFLKDCVNEPIQQCITQHGTAKKCWNRKLWSCRQSCSPKRIDSSNAVEHEWFAHCFHRRLDLVQSHFLANLLEARVEERLAGMLHDF